jgi:hypothetical protein
MAFIEGLDKQYFIVSFGPLSTSELDVGFVLIIDIIK